MTRRAVATVVAVLVGAVLGSGCGDGRPPFCDDLARNADLGALTKALDARDLRAARRAADEFRDLADGAPADVRADMAALAAAVSDIVGLLSDERTAGPGTQGSTSTTAPTGDGATDGDPADVGQRREELNRRLADLSGTSARVEDWASHTCGITLT